MQIYQILDKIDGYQLFVPAFQREYVWKKKDAKDLISSLVREYPTGTMLTWETNNPPELKSKNMKSEKFYVRSGNSSQELGISEIAPYINSHFNGV